MFKLIYTFLKIGLFSLLVVILSQLIHWNGKTISDQVKIGLAHPEVACTLSTIRQWAIKMTHDARRGFQKKMKSNFKTKTPAEHP